MGRPVAAGPLAAALEAFMYVGYAKSLELSEYDVIDVVAELADVWLGSGVIVVVCQAGGYQRVPQGQEYPLHGAQFQSADEALPWFVVDVMLLGELEIVVVAVSTARSVSVRYVKVKGGAVSSAMVEATNRPATVTTADFI